VINNLVFFVPYQDMAKNRLLGGWFVGQYKNDGSGQIYSITDNMGSSVHVLKQVTHHR
jgi:YD repeat-containing protein